MNGTRTYDGGGCQGIFSDITSLEDDAGEVAVDGSNAWRSDLTAGVGRGVDSKQVVNIVNDHWRTEGTAFT
jgi:hypothetical protein